MRALPGVGDAPVDVGPAVLRVDLQGAVEVFDGGAQLAVARVRGAAVDVQGGVVGGELDGYVEELERAVELAGQHEHEAGVGVGAVVVLLEVHRLVVVSEGRLELLEVLVGLAPSQVEPGDVREQLDGLGEVLDGLLVLA